MQHLSSIHPFVVQANITEAESLTFSVPSGQLPISGPAKTDYQFLVHPQKTSIYAAEQINPEAPKLQLPLLLHATDKAILINQLLELHDRETPGAITVPGRLQALDGHSWITTELTAYALPGSYKELLGWHVMARLPRESPNQQASEKPLLQVLAHLYEAGQWHYCPQEGRLEIDETVKELLQLPAPAEFSANKLFRRLSREDRARLLKQVFKLQRKGGFFHIHLRFKTHEPHTYKTLTISGGAFSTKLGERYLSGVCFDNSQWLRYTSRQKLTNAFLDDTQDLGKIGCFQWSPDLNELEITPQLRKILDLEGEEEVSYAQLQQRISPADLERLQLAYRRMLTSQAESELTLRIRTPTGLQRSLWVRAKLLKEKNQVLSVVGIVQDVSERVERQVQIDAKDKIISGFLKNLPVSILAINKEEEIISVVGKGISRLFTNAKQLSGKSLSEALPSLLPGIREVLCGGAKSFQCDGLSGKQPFSLFNHYYFDEERQLAIGFSLDITEQKQAELAARQVHHLEHRHHLMDTFVHAVAHDLRAPVVNLDMLLSFFKDEKDKSEQERYVAAMTNGIQHLKRTLDALIEILRIEKDCSLTAEKIDFQALIQELSYEYGDKLREAGGSINTFLQAESITYNRAYLSSILRNLISNAINYAAPDRPPQITICTEKRGSLVMMIVQDNGMGIDLKRWNHLLFKPFKRFNSQKRGTGIGLHLIRQMIEKNGGKIKVKSQPGEGTSFFCFLRPYR
jgi:signal transduction histidine kinase